MHLRLTTLQSDFYVFQRNYDELKGQLRAATAPEAVFRLWATSNRAQFELVTKEIDRLFHNFVASAKSLVDHTRNVIRDRYEATAFWAEYTAKVDECFASDPLVAFVHDARNYTLHYRLTVTWGHLKVTMSEKQVAEATSYFYLNAAPLLRWKGWSPRARAHIQTAGVEIVLEPTADAYHQRVRAFHSWLHTRLRDIHRDDLAWLVEMGTRIGAALPDEGLV